MSQAWISVFNSVLCQKCFFFLFSTMTFLSYSASFCLHGHRFPKFLHTLFSPLESFLAICHVFFSRRMSSVPEQQVLLTAGVQPWASKPCPGGITRRYPRHVGHRLPGNVLSSGVGFHMELSPATDRGDISLTPSDWSLLLLVVRKCSRHDSRANS